MVGVVAKKRGGFKEALLGRNVLEPFDGNSESGFLYERVAERIKLLIAQKIAY